MKFNFYGIPFEIDIIMMDNEELRLSYFDKLIIMVC